MEISGKTKTIPENFIEFMKTTDTQEGRDLEEAINKGIEKTESILGKNNWELVFNVGKPHQTEDVVHATLYKR